MKIDNVSDLANIPGIPLVPEDPDFFVEYADAASDQERLDINREVWRLLLPNNFWLSSIQNVANENDGLAVDDDNFNFEQSGHLPFYIQALK